ncbi:MAG: divalent-cation tolerance protein CutA [Myxococcota bacterium]|nr:divalent-cation tolerance protein CutA [Myxococcota bacterium]
MQVTFVTAPDAEVAREIARALVDERLAACVNVVPGIASVYRWEGAVQEDSEVLLIVKSRAGRAAALAERVRALHPYDLPEVLALPAVGGSEAYLDWVRSEVAS